MQASDKPETIEIDGRGSLVTAVSAHGADRRHFTVFKDVITDTAKRIRKRPGIGSPQGALHGASVTAMHEFVLVNGAVVDYYLIRASDTVIQIRKNGAAWASAVFPSGYAPTAGGLWVFTNVDKICLAVNGKDAALKFDGTTWKLAGAEGPLSPMLYAIAPAYSTGTVTATTGSKEIVSTIGANWSAATMDGHTMEINGIQYTIDAVTVGGGGGVAQKLNLTENFKELGSALLPYKIFDGPCSWDTPPVYAYGYEDPVTGHATNIRAASVTTENTTRIAETSQRGRALTLTNILYSPSAYAAGFTKIRLYRTPLNGNLLRALATTLDNNAAPGSTSFAETAVTWSDTHLTSFPAPRTELGVAPSALKSICYRMGRACGVRENRYHFSLHDLELTNKLGIAALSWPAGQNRLLAQARGLVLVGTPNGTDALIVQTAAGDYMVSGFDQNDMDVNVMATWKAGSYQYGAIDSKGELLSLYADKKLLAFPSGDDYGLPVQGKLDLIGDVVGARLHRFAGAAGDFLFVSVRRTTGSSSNDVTYVYDYNAESWYEWTVGFTAFVTAHDPTTGLPELWASTAAGASYKLLQVGVWQDGGADFAPQFTTVVLRPFAEFGVASELLATHLFVSNASFTWTGEFLINEQAAGSGVATPYAAAEHDVQSAQGRQLIWPPSESVTKRSPAVQLTVTFPTANSDFYVEKFVALFTAGQNVERVA